MIKKPMKGESSNCPDDYLDELKYPMMGSPKIDGRRAVIIHGVVLSSNLKPIPNKFIQNFLGRSEFNGLDGELTVGDPLAKGAFNKSGAVMRKNGQPDFCFHVFDNFQHKEKSYKERWLDIMDKYRGYERVKVVHQQELMNKEELLWFEERCINIGYEGIMIRRPDYHYKEGRSTLLQQGILKRKPVADAVARIIDFGEAVANKNQAQINNLGLTQRSTAKSGMVKKGTLGFLKVKCVGEDAKKFPKEFSIGAGAGQINKMKDEIWQNQEKYLGKLVEFTYQPYGSDKFPRFPIVKGFREEEDVTEW